MLDRLRKRFGTLIGGKSVVLGAEPAGNAEVVVERQPNDIEALLLARRDSQKRESRLILSEKIHNRAAVLLNEVRTDLLQEIHRGLEGENDTQTLKTLLEVALDAAFTSKLDVYIDEITSGLLEKLQAEFKDDPDAVPRLPSRGGFANELRNYRDEVLRRHLLEQVEVLALPTSTQAFPLEDGSSDELQDRISQYWLSCRESLDKFFRSVEMVLLDGARSGIHLDPRLIRNRLVAAQYRNGYRLLEDRFRNLYSEVIRLQMSTDPEEERRVDLDRQVVDEIIVPLAYFIRERAEPEPREALASRAELLREIVDKLVVVPQPLNQTAEAIKPVLRKSVEQARPLVLRDHPYLRNVVESLNPAAIHRTTALLRVFETLVVSELDPKSLKTTENVIRLNRAQYRLLQQLENGYADLQQRLSALDRIDERDADLISDLIEHAAPPQELVEDLLLALGYLVWPDALPEDSAHLLRLLATLVRTSSELAADLSLYQDASISSGVRSRLAQALVEQLDSGSVGADERQSHLGAVPLPIDLSKALRSMGYHPDDKERLSAFTEEVRTAVEDGAARELADAIRRVRQLATAVENERISLGATGTDGDPYHVEIWLTPSDVMLGLVLCKMEGYGWSPVEIMKRDPNGGNRKETEEKLRRQLQNQALVYQTFYRLFSRGQLLEKNQRRSLPSFVKKIYEPTEPVRHLLLSRLRHATELVTLVGSFAKLIVDADPDAAADAGAVSQILSGLARKVNELAQSTDKSRDAGELGRVTKEYERALKYLNTVIVHSVNPWLEAQTAELANEFEFRKEEVREAVRRYTALRGIDWECDVENFDAHGIRGTLGCRALIRLADGSSKVALLSYQPRYQTWKVRYLGPRVTDVVREALRQKGRRLPDDYDEKHEQPTFSLDEQSCRFFLLKREVARIEATLVLDASPVESLWKVAYLKYNDDVLTDRTA